MDLEPGARWPDPKLPVLPPIRRVAAARRGDIVRGMGAPRDNFKTAAKGVLVVATHPRPFPHSPLRCRGVVRRGVPGWGMICR